MKKLLTDIELDFYELKCLLAQLSQNKEDTQLLRVAQRSLANLNQRIGVLNEEFTQHFAESNQLQVRPQEPQKRIEEVAKESANKMPPPIPSSEVSKQAASPTADVAELGAVSPSPSPMYRSLSLNDVFRYSRELFGGDTTRLKQVVAEMDKLGGYEQAMGYLVTQISCNLDDYAFQDMDEFLKSYFKYNK